MKFQLVVRVKMIIAKPNGALFLSFFRTIIQNSVIVEVGRLCTRMCACVCVCVCRNICTYNWNGLPLKNNNKKKGTRRSDAYSLAQDRFKNSIEFETVRNSLSNPYVYIYTYSQALSVILLPTSAQPTFLLQIHFILLSPRK